MTKKKETPSGLEDWQAKAFLDAADVWEEHGDQAERAGPASEDDRLDLPAPDHPEVRWVVPFDERSAGGGGDLSGVGELVDPRLLPGAPKRKGPRPGYGKTIRWAGAPNTCGVVISKGALANQRCPRIAGQGTPHVGAGPCAAHGGNKRYQRAVGAWLMAHAFAQELNITPWEAMLKAVRIAAGKVAYCEWVLGTASSDLELEGRVVRSDDGEESLLIHPDTGEPLGVGAFRDLSFWVKQSELWHDRMAKTAKMAIDAGVAKWQIEKAETEANAIARVLNAVVEAIEDEISPAQLARMRTVMRTELLQLAREAAPSTATPLEVEA